MNSRRRIARKILAPLAGFALVMAGTTAAVTATAMPAHATTMFTASAAQRMPYGAGLVGFSATANGASMSRNVAMIMSGATPGGPIWYGVHDTTSTDVNAWYGGWTQADGSGNVRDIIITGIPRSACGHSLFVAATDADTGAASPAVYITDQCGPMVAVMGPVSTIVGDGFTPGGTVKVAAYSNGTANPPTWKATTTAATKSPNLAGGYFRVTGTFTCSRSVTVSGKDVTSGATDTAVAVCFR